MLRSLLYILPLLFSQYSCIQAANSALCFLTFRPVPETIRFAQRLADDAVSYNLDVFLFIDENQFNTSNLTSSPNLRLMKISNEQCIANGYQKTISLGNNWRQVTAWDKALLYFARLNKTYSFVWLIEDDVFISTVQALRSLHELYSNTSDFVVPRNTLNLIGDTSTWHWPMAVGKLLPPWSCSMVNTVGFSRRMLTAIDDYVRWLGEVPFHEFFFNTLAMQLRLNIVAPTELSTIVYGTLHLPEYVIKQPNNLWHPFKNRVLQHMLHEKYANKSTSTNLTRNFTSFETLCLNASKWTSTEEYLSKVLADFEIEKIRFSPGDRRALRRTFTQLAERCQSHNASNKTISLARILADHAYKLPEPLVKELVKNKSSEHLKLEQALKENREAVFKLPLNSSLLTELRKVRRDLMIQLTKEMKREMISQQQSLTSTSSSTTTSSSTVQSTRKSVKVSYILREQIDRQISESTEDNAKILFLFLFMLSVIFILLQVQIFQSQKHYIFIFVFALLILFWCIA